MVLAPRDAGESPTDGPRTGGRQPRHAVNYTRLPADHHKQITFTSKYSNHHLQAATLLPCGAMAKESPLAWMQTLSEAVSLHSPLSTPPASDPELVLIMTYMAAKEIHITKYARHYSRLYPSSRILVVQCPLRHVVMPWRVRPSLAPAVPYLASLAAKPDTKPRLLVHVFSNGGVHTASILRSMLRDSCLANGTIATKDAPFMPRYVLVMDSCPGRFRWTSSYRAVMQSLPWFFSPFVHLSIALVCLYHYLRRLPSIQDRNAAALRAPHLLAREVRRAYLYGTEDDLVLWQDVEENAQLAAQAGFNVVMDKFHGARHVALAKAAPERYWRAVAAAWTGHVEEKVDIVEA